ncbi:C1 family peptidase [Methanobrevibacter sp.]|uniref:C1 family peptidase n=1 Tax=Methanobrevibacter sp. TaxID=66852 RepID=UPI003890823D
MITCIMLTASCAFASDAANETISQYDDSQNLQVVTNNVNDTYSVLGDSAENSEVYFDANAASDGNGSKESPYKYYQSDRIPYGGTVYFADGVYNIAQNEATSIHSSSTYKTTFIGQSIENTILTTTLTNKFAFTVTDGSYFVLKNLRMDKIHISNHANIIADNVAFTYSKSFTSSPGLSYSYISKTYESTYGGVIICDTPFNKKTTLNLTNCQFISNSAESGGVIAAYNTIANIQNCLFDGSSANRFGGAIYSIKSSFNIQNSSFTGNKAKYAGAIYANCSDFHLKDSQFLQSQATSFGGVIASFSSILDINNVIFNDYVSLNDAGGAIYATGGTINIADSKFVKGYSDFGGAISSLKTNSTITGTEFRDNHATYYGGSIYNMYGNLILTENTFKNSHALSGGSIFNRLSDLFTLSNNQFINSTANEGHIVFIDGGNVKVDQKGNTYDSVYELLKYGNIYDIDYYKSVPIINYTPEVISVVPSSYDSRKYGYITPAKDQMDGGNCWAFSGIATLEACLKKATGIEYDFSEENVKNLMSEYSLFDSDTGANSGGNLYMFIAYLASWFGPIYDEYDVYDDYSALSFIHDSEIHVQNVYILPERQNFYDNDHIKQAVMKYGAVSIGIELGQNKGHAVTIVGWDDEFTSSDFLGNKALGAWIVKNSWGTEWGYNGFGYLSYQQPITFGYTFIFDDDRGYSNIYQYDFEGKSGFHSIVGNQVSVKNKFTAEKDEILSAFSTYFDVPTNYTASIYKNGELMTTQKGFSEIGYYTIPLTNEVSLKKGDNFEVEITFFGNGQTYFPISSASEINKINFGEGISFFKTTGNWNDLYNYASVSGVACIKAFTRTDDLSEISLDVNPYNHFDNIYVEDLVNIGMDIDKYCDVDGIQRLVDGLVTFTVNGTNYFATVENGKATLNISFEKEGTYDITAQFKSSRAISKVVEFKINVAKTNNNLVIQTQDVSKFYGSSEKYTVTFINDGNPLVGENVKISVNGKDYDEKTDANGQVVLDLSDLPVGVYYVSAQRGGKVVTSKFAVLSTIVTNDMTQDFFDSYVSASFLNTDGNVLKNADITFSISYYNVNSNPIEYSAVTDNEGLAIAKIGSPYILPVEKYSVSVVNPVSGEKKEFILDIAQIDSECLLSVVQDGSDVIINATVGPLGIPATGDVNFIVLGKVYKKPVESVRIGNNRFYIASLKLDNLAVGKYTVSATYSGNQNLRVSSDSREFSVTKNPYILNAETFATYYGGSFAKATIADSNGDPVKGETVYATIRNNTYTATTDEKGEANFLNLNLEVGEYPVLYEYNGQSIERYLFIYSTITMDGSDAEYLNSKLGANFENPFSYDLSNMEVKFIVNGNEYTATTDSNGYASVDVDLPVGTHTITTVNTKSGEKKISQIKIYKTTPSISISKSKRDNSIFITAEITHTSAMGYVVFTMGSNKYTTILSKGKAVLALSVLEEGSYSVYANYIGDPNFNNIKSKTLDFDYEITNYTLTTQKVEKYYGGSEKFTVTLTNFNKPVSNAVIQLLINDVSYNITTDANGVATLKSELNPGIYSVLATFEDRTALAEITVKSTITVVGAVEDVSTDKLNVELIDGNGNLIKNTAVTFKINSAEYKATTDASGIASLEVGLNRGDYKVTIINPVTGENKNTNLKVTKSTPTLSLSQVNENGVDVLKAVLPKDATGTVDFVVENEGEYSFELDGGIARLEGLEPGEYLVTVNYHGNDIFKPVSKSTTFVVSEVKGVITSVSTVKTTYGTAKKLVITLKDSLGNNLMGRIVKLSLNNKVYSAQIYSDGMGSINIPANLVPKTYTAKITYSGEEDILGTSKTIKVVVSKATPKLTAAKKTFKIKDKTKKYVVTLKTDKNKVYKNQKITIKVNGKTYAAKTNKKGQATFKLTKLTKKGTFTATVKFAGNAYYKAVTKKIKITVKK